MTEDERNAIAREIVYGKKWTVFNDEMVRLGCAMPLMASKEDYTNVGMILGDNEQTAPRSVNNYPVFFGVKLVSVEDWKLIRSKVQEIVKLINEKIPSGKEGEKHE
jgi:hypothetical protein